jgi:hypothetical protein
VARGYINDAELTALKFVQNPFTNSSSSLLLQKLAISDDFCQKADWSIEGELTTM